jgi:hypothetical protein
MDMCGRDGALELPKETYAREKITNKQYDRMREDLQKLKLRKFIPNSAGADHN